MRFIGDFHIHSHFSIATSKQLTPEYLDFWAKLKGIKVVGTGDFSHPGWTKELQEKLEPAEQGLYTLKKDLRITADPLTPTLNSSDTRFLLTAEISCIYKKYGKVRKIHNLIFAPDFETVTKIQEQLRRLNFNISSDGRPIIGFDARDLLELVLNINPNCYFVPAHIWTPWFSALGSKSGFDSIEDCFGDLSEHITAVETGLSSDAPMNWMCSFLDKYTLLSNSDAHSPEKLGRNANILNTDLAYNSIIDAMKTGDPDKFVGTIDMYPQEGKYHYDGHRKCKICWDPVETLKHNETCPVCGKDVVLGVVNRITQLSDREDILQRKNRLPFYSAIPLKEILSEIEGVGPNSKKITNMYNNLLKTTESAELDILLDKPIDEIKNYNEILAEAIRRMRNGEIHIKEGFDGEFGEIKVFTKNEQKLFKTQNYTFSNSNNDGKTKRKLLNFSLDEYRRLKKSIPEKTDLFTKKTNNESNKLRIPELLKELNAEQCKATMHRTGSAIILAGPGTGKTKVLTVRIANLVNNCSIKAENILAITSSNKTADDMRKQLANLLNDKTVLTDINIYTFSKLGYSVLTKYYKKCKRKENFTIIDEDDKKLILANNLKYKKNQIKKLSNQISNTKQSLIKLENIKDPNFAEIFEKYEKVLQKFNLFDLDDLLYQPNLILNKTKKVLKEYRDKYNWILLDDYQNISFAQSELIKLLAPPKDNNLMIAGDPNQAIEETRKANIININDFTDIYKNAVSYKLNKSYRCTERILQASNDIIFHKSIQNKMLVGLRKGAKIKISPNKTDKSEAEFIVTTIEDIMNKSQLSNKNNKSTKEADIKNLSDFAILCRTSSQMNILEKSLNDHNISYQTISNTPFYNEEPLKTIIDLLKLSANPDNTFIKNKLAKLNIINQPKWIEFKALKEDKSVRNTIITIIDNHFIEQKNEYEAEFKRLLELSDNFGEDLNSFLTFVALSNDIDTYKQNTNRVNLMTINSSKGLEFESVFISGCEDGLLPYNQTKDEKKHTEEEKRLLYVGMTRAKKIIYLTHAEKRFMRGKDSVQQRSPFINSIEPELLEQTKESKKKKVKNDNGQLSLF